ncbi:MAG: (2Fe-2S)-binding protein [Desulfovibrionaceae bacterium]
MKFTDDILHAPDSELVCYCSRVSKGDILQAQATGATTLAEIKAVTGACTVAHCAVKSPRGRCCAREIRALLGTCDEPLLRTAL